jgi:hypothetical protein
MPRQEVRQKIQAYLERGLSEGAILSAGTVFPHPPKLTKQSDLYALSSPGTPDGAVIFMYLGEQMEWRVGMQGQHGGKKARVYTLNLITYFIWKGDDAEDADAANDAFVDSLTAWIEADRNAGTEAVSLGGDGSGVIFSWGEGPDPQAIGEPEKDIKVHTAFPKDFRGQAVQIFNLFDVAVIELLTT